MNRAVRSLLAFLYAFAFAIAPLPTWERGNVEWYSPAYAVEVDLQFIAGTQFLDSNGDPLAGGQLYFYDAGTTSDRTVYSDASGTVAHPQPVVLNSAGRLGSSVYIPVGSWKLKLDDSADVTVVTEDNIEGALDTSVFATGSVAINSPILSKTSDYTVTTSDAGKTIACNATGGPVTITLPSATTAGDGFYIATINTGTSGTCTFTAVGGQTINGSTNLQLTSQYATAQLYSDSADWHAFTLTIDDATITAAKLATEVTGQFMQIGSVIPWYGDTCPAGYLEANGQSVSRTTYADLFTEWSTRFGNVDGSTFNVVDLRGEFLRGFDDGAGIDPDAASRTDRGDGTTGDNIGTLQGDDFESHTHEMGTSQTFSTGAVAGMDPDGGTDEVSNAAPASGGNETRPRNVSTLFCIFASAELAAGSVSSLHTILNGSGAPGGGLGSDDDFYIDTTAHDIYGPKASGSWGSGTSLIGPTTGLAFNFDSSTTIADPGSGDVRFDAATLSSVAALAISDVDRNSADVDTDLLTWDDSTNTTNRGTIRIIDVADNSNFITLDVTGASTDNVGWVQFDVTHVQSNGTFTNGSQISLNFSRAGDSPVGQQTIYVPASAILCRTDNGCAAGLSETSTNKIILDSKDYADAADDFGQFSIQMPKSWDEGAVIAQFVWHGTDVTGDKSVVWALQGGCFIDDQAADTALGTAQSVTDANGAASNNTMITAETSAISLAGTATAEEWCVFQVFRDADNASDNFTGLASLLGVKLHITLDAPNDD